MDSLEIAKLAAAAASDKKAVRPILLDLRGQTDLCEYQFICSGENDRQTRAIASAIEEQCKAVDGTRPIAVEGRQTGNWILMDYGSTMIHIFQSHLRDYYGIEQLWPKAKFVDLKADG
jgi:ribosome-associated protein